MEQSRLASLIETLVNVGSGFVLSYVITITLLPWLGYPVTHGQSLGIVCIYTVSSLIRSYVVRRLFCRRM